MFLVQTLVVIMSAISVEVAAVSSILLGTLEGKQYIEEVILSKRNLIW